MLAVNISAKQDDLVVPFMREHAYSFTTLKSTAEVARAYSVSGVPAEFVIDPEGRLVKKVRLSTDEREREFEKLLEDLAGK